MGIVANTISKLEENSIESSRANAETILTSMLGCRVADLYVDDIVLDKDQLKQLKDMIARRGQGEPLQYITGKVNFCGNELFIEPGVFIPRPETEILVDVIIKLVTSDPPSPIDAQTTVGLRGAGELSILDLCTGSGNIAISLTKRLPNCKIIASDISDKAIGLAKKSALFNDVSEKIDFVHADLFEIPEIKEYSFDIIVSNPPYIAAPAMKDLPEDVKREPKIALCAGKEGMDFYRTIIDKSRYFLKKNGILALELGDGIYLKVKDLLVDSMRFSDIHIFNDLNGVERVIVARKYTM